jgi:hypothetical protein
MSERKYWGANIEAQILGRKCRGAYVGAQIWKCKYQVRICEGAKIPHPTFQVGFLFPSLLSDFIYRIFQIHQFFVVILILDEQHVCFNFLFILFKT